MQIPINQPWSPALPFPFLGYRSVTCGDAPETVPSLTHFYESEKFRGLNDWVRQEVLSARNGHAATKVAARNARYVRPDWSRVHARVLRTGMLMQFEQSAHAIHSARAAFGLSMELSGTSRIGGISGALLASELQTVFQLRTTAAIDRCAIVVTSVPPDGVVDDLAMQLVSSPQRITETMLYCGADSYAKMESALQNCAVPVRHLLPRAKKLRIEQLCGELDGIGRLMYHLQPAMAAQLAQWAMLQRPRIDTQDLAHWTIRPKKTPTTKSKRTKSMPAKSVAGDLVVERSIFDRE